MNRSVGFVISGEIVTVVDAEVPDNCNAPLTIINDDTWKLQKGGEAQAYAVLHQRCTDYLRENEVSSAVVKASALPTSGAPKLGLLKSAEVRGVIIAAAASVCEVRVIAKSAISRRYGKRKVDDYVRDDGFWDEHTFGGQLRKTSREAAMLLIATRDQ